MAIVLTKLQHESIDANAKDKVQALQQKLYLKAKANSEYKFYCLYDKIFRLDVIRKAYGKVKSNKGGAGIDGKDWEYYEDGKDEELILEIHQELKEQTYKPSLLKEVKIPKSNGKMRTLRIPTIKDRVVQMAMKLIIEPIFEADFQPNSYGYRPKIGTHDAVNKMNKELFKDVYTAENKKLTIQSIDLSQCFDTIPHKELIQQVVKRIIDNAVINLIKMFLKVGTMNEEVVKSDTGTPQGGVISPLLANIYLNQVDLYWKQLKMKGDMLRYADDIVLLLKPKEEEKYQRYIEYLEKELKLVVNKEKTVTEFTKTGIHYLGFEFIQRTSQKHKEYLLIQPSKKSIMKLKESIKLLLRKASQIKTEDVIKLINMKLKGGQAYFDNIGMGTVRGALNKFVFEKLAKFISKRKKYNKICWKLFEKGEIYEEYGVYYMKTNKRAFG